MKHAPAGNRPLGFSPGRRLQFMLDPRNDPYRAKRKARGVLRCPDCGLLCLQGRWQSESHAQSAAIEAAAAMTAHRCPACQRIADRYPAGTLTIEGPYAYEHRSEVLQTARNVAERLQTEHPLERIMDIEALDGRLRITTTDVHLVQSIGKALHHAFGGLLHYGFAEGQYQLRVNWVA
ncbi:MAG: hypothetical protein RLZ51_788 [Pseudomonadota bacterium]